MGSFYRCDIGGFVTFRPHAPRDHHYERVPGSGKPPQTVFESVHNLQSPMDILGRKLSSTLYYEHQFLRPEEVILLDSL